MQSIGHYGYMLYFVYVAQSAMITSNALLSRDQRDYGSRALPRNRGGRAP